VTHGIRPAGPGDRDILVDLMTEFYAETATPFDPDAAAPAFQTLLGDPGLGRAWIVESAGAAVGYAVLAMGFSLQFGGRDAFLDDLFIQRGHRGRGLGRAAVRAVLDECASRGVRALHLEVARDNLAAKELYRRFGFADHGFQMMTVRTAGDTGARTGAKREDRT
jgi:ribosomal protein S18 acetylase RimI-like enzyme